MIADGDKLHVNGVTYAVHDAGEGPLVLLIHGFPETRYSWRHQIAPLVDAGYRVAVPDVLGYGESDAPQETERYAMEHLTSDMASIIEELSNGRGAVVVGHDWGAPIAWNTALLYPDHVRAVCGLSVPYSPPGPVPSLQVMDKVFTQRGLFFYQIYFQEPGLAEAELERDPRDTLRRFYYALSGAAPDGTWPKDKRHGDTLLHRLPDPEPFPDWLTEDDIDVYTRTFEASGFRGPLNRYRNDARDHAFLRALDDHTIYQPSLFIGGTRDLVLRMRPGFDVVDAMRPALADLRGAHLLEGCGHWTQQERPEDVNRILLDWLASL